MVPETVCFQVIKTTLTVEMFGKGCLLFRLSTATHTEFSGTVTSANETTPCLLKNLSSLIDQFQHNVPTLIKFRA